MTKILKLEQIAKEKNKLEVRIVKLEQTTKLITNDLKFLKYSTSLPNKSCSNDENMQIKNSLTHHEVDQSMTSTDLVTLNTLKQIVNTISNISNFNKTCSGKFKSLENKEINVFLDLENKKRVSNEIKQKNKEKKFQNLSLVESKKIINKIHNQNLNESFKPSINFDSIDPFKYNDDFFQLDKNQIVEQDLKQELSTSPTFRKNITSNRNLLGGKNQYN
ncbi:hypothetical protein Glove_9g25 [Diversispora epigaea]|uniref:Uncharacterized protein n=1 Tax=Diversispora epigaea TaxID=1348612 RepID=A0A397JYS4_9GLOM|nr:hypothetical protein Glove_9g25 [Diversispora epigaea]